MKKNGRLLIHKALLSGQKFHILRCKKSAISNGGASTTRLIIYFCNAELFLSDMVLVISDFLHKHHLLNLQVAICKVFVSKVVTLLSPLSVYFFQYLCESGLIFGRHFYIMRYHVTLELTEVR